METTTKRLFLAEELRSHEKKGIIGFYMCLQDL